MSMDRKEASGGDCWRGESLPGTRSERGLAGKAGLVPGAGGDWKRDPYWEIQ